MKVLNDLFDYKNLKIFQDDHLFKFSIDSVLLAEFVRIKNENQIIIDFCTGNAPIPLILSTKYPNKIWGIEIQKYIFELGEESIKLNNKNTEISLINDNIINIRKYFKAESFDIITCNPPYFKYSEESLVNNYPNKTIARHEVEINFETIVELASFLLKNRGEFNFIHRPERLEELLVTLNKRKLTVKQMQFVHSNNSKNANMVLIKAIKNGKIGVKVLKPLILDGLKSYQNIVGE